MHSDPGAECHERVARPNGSNENIVPEPDFWEVSQTECEYTAEIPEARERMKREVEGGD